MSSSTWSSWLSGMFALHLKIEGGTGGNIFTHSLCDAAHVFSWVNLGVCVVLFACYGPA